MKHIEANTVTISKSAVKATIELCKEFGLNPATIKKTNKWTVIRNEAAEMVATISTRFGKKALISIDVKSH